jgi:hypothetical protein
MHWFPVVMMALVPVAAPASLREQLLAPGGFDRLGFEKSVLVASGAESDEDLRGYLLRLHQVVDLTVARAQGSLQRGERLDEKLLAVLHRDFLGEYRADIGDMRVTLRTGFYNCLSATTLFVLVGRAAGLNVSAYGMKGHVMPLVFDENGAWYLEATNPTAQVTRTFVAPQRAYREALASLPRQNTETLRVDPARLRDLQRTGADKDAIRQEKAPTTREEAEKFAQARAQELRDSTFDADPQALASMFYWNRAISAARARQPADMMVGLAGFSSLASPADLDRSRTFRMRMLVDVARVHRRENGFEATLHMVDAVVAATRSAAERDALDTIRVQLLRDETDALAPPRRCEFVRLQATRFKGNQDYLFLQTDTCPAP